MKIENCKLKIDSKGQSLMMLLVIIVVAGIILGLGSQFIAIRVKTKEVAKQRIVSSRLAQEGLEAVRAIAREDWHNIDDKTLETEYYLYVTPEEKWVLTTNTSYKSPSGFDKYERWIIFHQVLRNEESGNIVESGGANDPSTRKVTAYARHTSSGREISVDYYLTRWENEAVLQQSWAGGRGEEGPVIDFGDKYYDSFGVAATAEGWLKLRTDWYDSDWQYRQKITINHTKVPSDQTNFPVLITEANIDTKIFTNAKDGGADIRFTVDDGRTEIPREIELFDKGNSKMAIWAKTDLSSTVDTVLYIYYGNPDAAEPPRAGEFGAENVWDGNFVGVWHKNDETTSTILDSTASANHGNKTGPNQPVETDGKINKAQDFDEDLNWYINCENEVYISSPYTIEAWVKVPPNPEYYTTRYLLDLGALFEDWPKFSPHYGNTNKPLIFLGQDNYRYGTSDISDNQWHHIVFIVTGDWQNDILNAKIYINGVEESYYFTLYTGDPVPPSANIHIGSGRFQGLIDEVRVSSGIERSADWITTSYNTQNSPSTFYSVAAEEKY